MYLVNSCLWLCFELVLSIHYVLLVEKVKALVKNVSALNEQNQWLSQQHWLYFTNSSQGSKCQPRGLVQDIVCFKKKPHALNMFEI